MGAFGHLGLGPVRDLLDVRCDSLQGREGFDARRRHLQGGRLHQLRGGRVLPASDRYPQWHDPAQRQDDVGQDDDAEEGWREGQGKLSSGSGKPTDGSLPSAWTMGPLMTRALCNENLSRIWQAAFQDGIDAGCSAPCSLFFAGFFTPMRHAPVISHQSPRYSALFMAVR